MAFIGLRRRAAEEGDEPIDGGFVVGDSLGGGLNRAGHAALTRPIGDSAHSADGRPSSRTRRAWTVGAVVQVGRSGPRGPGNCWWSHLRRGLPACVNPWLILVVEVRVRGGWQTAVVELLIARNPDLDSALSFLLRVPLGAEGLVFRTKGTWPRTSVLYCHPVSCRRVADGSRDRRAVAVVRAAWRGD